jgi:nucleotide-binding universal stress UspA family protein
VVPNRLPLLSISTPPLSPLPSVPLLEKIQRFESAQFPPLPVGESAGIDPKERLQVIASNKLNGTTPYEIEVVMGDAAAEIVQGEARHQCDSVVMATHGHTGIKHLILGSVAERVVRESAVPVLTVRPNAD